MCGITGLVLGRKARSAEDFEDIKFSFIDSLIAAESRGVDASGIFVINEGGEHYFYRAPVRATKLSGQAGFWNVLDKVSASTIAIVGHTRAATTGSPKVIDNNHPIYDPPLVGVHNGVIHNHMDLRAKYGAVADVDSATILSMLNSKLSDSQTLTRSIIAKTMPEAKGSWAIAIADTRKDTLYLARNSGSPMQLTWQKRENLLWFASTERILEPISSKRVKSVSMPANTVMALTRANAETGNTTHIGIKAPLMTLGKGFPSSRAKNDVVAPQITSSSYARQWKYPSFFDNGATTAAILKNREEK
jgi:glucosamine--fructose-6-phosphate aminotransferase (isomerizing)